MFEIKSNPQLDKNHFTFRENGEYPYFTRTVFNNGILGYVDFLDDEHKIQGGCLAVGMIGMQFFYLDNDFYAGQFTKRAIPKNFFLTPAISNYFISILNKNQKYFQNLLVRNFEKEFNKTKIHLPTKNGEIDFDFMENFIAELEAERIAELEAYLTATGLKDYNLTREEEEALNDFGNLEWCEFKITELFDIKNTQNIIARDIVKGSGKTPYLCSSQANNAIDSYISYSEKFLDKGNCIFIGGKTFAVTYQSEDFFSNDSHNLVLYLKEKENADLLTQLYLITCIYRGLQHKYSWGDSISNKKIQKDTIYLPLKDEQIYYSSMKTFIKAIQKLVIKDVVLYADKKIEASKTVVSKNE